MDQDANLPPPDCHTNLETEGKLVEIDSHKVMETAQSLPSTKPTSLPAIYSLATTTTNTNEEAYFISDQLSLAIQTAEKSLAETHFSDEEGEDKTPRLSTPLADRTINLETISVHPANSQEALEAYPNQKQKISPELSCTTTEIEMSIKSPGILFEASTASSIPSNFQQAAGTPPTRKRKTSPALFETSTEIDCGIPEILVQGSQPPGAGRNPESLSNTFTPTSFMPLVQLETLESAHPGNQKRASSPGSANSERNVRSRIDNHSDSNSAEADKSESKPLRASAALLTYSKLMTALEEARLSDCLTRPMEIDLENLRSRCQKTGTAIIHQVPLPPEDKVVIILDNEVQNLATTYGGSVEAFDASDCDSNVQDKQSGDLPGTASIENSTTSSLESGNRNVLVTTNESSCESQIDILDEGTSVNVDSSHIKIPQNPRVSFPETEEASFPPSSNNSNPAGENTNSIASPLQSTLPEASDTPETHLQQSPPVHTTSKGPEKQIPPPTSAQESSAISQEKGGSAESTAPLINVKAQVVPTRELRTRIKTKVPIENSNSTSSSGPSTTPTSVTSRKKTSSLVSSKKKVGPGKCPLNEAETLDEVETTNKSEGNKSGNNSGGSSAMEQELKELLSPYNTNQTTKKGKLTAWKALNSLLERRRLGEPLDQVFLDCIDGGVNNVVIRTKLNAQSWFEAIDHTMPELFNSHKGEPAHALGFFNTLLAKTGLLADKVPPEAPPFWHHTWRCMRMSLRPSATRVSSFLKVLLDSVLLTGKTFLKEPEIPESEKKKTGVDAVCQAIQWLNSQKSSKANHSKTVRLLDTSNLDSVIDIGLIQQWQELFFKVLDSYLVQYFEANYILNEEASSEDKAVALSFKKDWRGDSLKSPTLGYLTMFACCGIRGLICCSNDVNLTPAGQMLSFAVLSEWLSKQRPDFEVKEPIFKRSNQMLMKLIDGLFDKEGHFVRPEVTWYDVAKNLCFDYLSYWFTEAGEIAAGGNLVFPKSSAFVGKDQTIKFSEVP
ncbi:uncharacterized protein MELLADRAFT_63193 [Melampsora larici-populina 98AG31]|uniref:Uncharacterized protein n=1 Tax=Melampsora larici-populina (strain 98AG31 / pathotype 3-4-7) TaxID=747676 RepID=F4RLS4_MELLP|nr:uncharacterized protein MELLADRAFT_63193 [Melampsora larici-populina 98AG31]EGG06587.1 hypothetical protein MELLADRAFT_63193 [Melampsora larici-populina 98AG31]